MRNRFKIKIPVMGVLLILFLCVSATAGIGYSNLDDGKIKSSVYSAVSEFFYDMPDLTENPENGERNSQPSVIEPGTLMLFGLGLVGLLFIGRIRISRF